MAFEKLSSFFGINDDEDFEEKPVETPQPKKIIQTMKRSYQ